MELEQLIAPVGDRIIVELTEHAPVDDYAPLKESLERLRRSGALIAVDDVGAGFATLRHVLRLAPDIVKLDLSLTHDLESDSTARALATALIAFCKKIGATVVAEGIETPGVLTLLRGLGVRQGQGYYLGRPESLAGAR